MVLAAREKAWRYAAVATLASVAGGFLGYAIGYYLFAALGRPILEFYGAMARYDAMQQAYAHWGAWIIVLKGMTPIPYKIVTIASGAFHFPLVGVRRGVLVSRAMRFFLVAALLYIFGDPVRVFIEKRLTLVTSAFVILAGGRFRRRRLSLGHEPNRAPPRPGAQRRHRRRGAAVAILGQAGAVRIVSLRALALLRGHRAEPRWR